MNCTLIVPTEGRGNDQAQAESVRAIIMQPMHVVPARIPNPHAQS